MPKQISVKNFTEITKALQGLVKELQNISSKTIEKVGDELTKANKGAEDLVEEVKDLNEELDEMAKEGGITAVFKADKMKKIGKQLQDLSGKMKADPSGFRKYNKEAQNLRKNLEEAKQAEPFKYFSDKIKKAHAPLKGFASNLGNTAEGLTSVAGKMGKLGGVAKVAGAGLGRLSGFLGGPWGMAAAVGMEVVKAVVKIDSYIKNLNKKFAAIRGPTLVGTDGRKQFKEFNDAIFNIGQNIRDGLNADEVFDFMAGMNIAGKNITTLDKGFDNYRDSVHTASRASKVFGMDISAVGSEMGKMSMEFQMNLKEIDDAFIQVFFDAEKSGYSTDKFWNAITNATASLTFYGKFLKDASKTLTEFSKNSRLSQADATGLTNTVENIFTNMDTGEKMTTVVLGGIKNAKALIAEAYSELQDQMKKNATDIAAAQVILKSNASDEDKKRAKEELDRLFKEQESLKQRKEVLEPGTKEKASVYQISQALVYSGKALEHIYDAINQDLGGRDVEALRKGDTQWETMVLKLMVSNSSLSRADAEKIISSFEVNTDLMVRAFSSISKDQAEGVRTAIFSLNPKSTVDEIKSVGDKISQNIPTMGTEAAQAIAAAAAQDPEAMSQIQKILTKIKEGTAKPDDIKKLVKQGSLGLKLAKKNLKIDLQASSSQKQQYQDTFQVVKDQTLSLSDMLNISKDGAVYSAAMFSHVDMISEGVGDIFDWMRKKWPISGITRSKSEIASGKAFNKMAAEYKNQQTDIGAALRESDPTQKYAALQRLLVSAIKSVEKEGISKEEGEKLNKKIALLTNLGQFLKKSGALDEKAAIAAEESAKNPPGLIYDVGPGGFTLSQPSKTQSFVLPLPDYRTQPQPSAPAPKRKANLREANLRDPMTVRSPGIVTLDLGETIMPSKNAALFREGTDTRATKAPSQNITISVNATEKDLAQRIANEVRAVLYQNSISSIG